MLELLLCSLLTIFPDYLFRRYVQGKRLGKEITLYSVWFELRWGITACLMLTVGLITVVFYNHPSTTNVTLFFRTVPIVPETIGRVAEVYVGVSGPVTQGAPIFRLDSSKQEAAVETARRKIAEVEAAMVVAQHRHRGGGRQDPGGQGAPTSRPWTNWRPSRSCIGATRASSRAARSRSWRSPWRAARARSMPPPPRRRPPRRGSQRCSRPKRPAPKPRWRRPRWIWKRPSSAPASTGAWSSSCCGSATSSIR